MQLAFGNVLLDGFGPAIKEAYDLTKALSQSVREGGAFAPMLENLRASFVVLLDPLTSFLTNLTESVKALNESGLSLDNLSGQFERLAPLITGAGAALSFFAGSNLLSMIPGLGKLAGMIGAKGPIALGLTVLSERSSCGPLPQVGPGCRTSRSGRCPSERVDGHGTYRLTRSSDYACGQPGDCYRSSGRGAGKLR